MGMQGVLGVIVMMLCLSRQTLGMMLVVAFLPIIGCRDNRGKQRNNLRVDVRVGYLNVLLHWRNVRMMFVFFTFSR